MEDKHFTWVCHNTRFDGLSRQSFKCPKTTGIWLTAEAKLSRMKKTRRAFALKASLLNSKALKALSLSRAKSLEFEYTSENDVSNGQESLTFSCSVPSEPMVAKHVEFAAILVQIDALASSLL